MSEFTSRQNSITGESATTSTAGSPLQAPKSATVVTKTDGRFWSPEVVKALCQRLPGGRASMTKRCVVCKSQFYPCLCALNADKNERVLKPPRIVRLVERLNPETHEVAIHPGRCGSDVSDPGCANASGWGNLRVVPIMANHPGMVKSRALVSAYDETLADEACDCGKRVLHHELECKHCGKKVHHAVEVNSIEAGEILWRSGERYAIKPDHAKPWYQILQFSTLTEFKEVQNCLDEDRMVGKTIPSLLKAPTLCIEVVYNRSEDARGDVELAEAGDGFYVTALRHGGEAYNNGVRGGHKLHALYHSSPDTKPRSADHRQDNIMWLPVKPKEGLPAILRPPQECSRADIVDDLDWPIFLQFHALPTGWVAVGALSGVDWKDELPLTKDGLVATDDIPDDVKDALTRALKDTSQDGTQCTELLSASIGTQHGYTSNETPDLGKESSLGSVDTRTLSGSIGRALLTDQRWKSLKLDKPLTVVFMRCPWRVIARNHIALRHEHKWEPNIKNTRKDDYELLHEWGLKAKMTPAQLSFCFKKLADTLKKELQGFNELKSENLKQFINKAVIYVDNERKLDHMTGRERVPLEKQREVHRNQMHALCNLVPLHFLLDIQHACRAALPDADLLQPDLEQAYSQNNFGNTNASSPVMSRSSTSHLANPFGPPVKGMVPDIGNMQAMVDMDGGRRDLLTSMVDKKTGFGEQSDLGDEIHSIIVLSLSKFDLKREYEKRVSRFLVEHISEYVEKVKAAEDDKPRGRKNRKKQKDEDLAPKTCSTDGRLSYDEFVQVMLKAGITGQSTQDMHAKFDAVDQDKSGRLNLAEVLTAANRMQFLVQKARAYENKQLEQRRKISQFEIMKEFAEYVRSGDDLEKYTAEVHSEKGEYLDSAAWHLDGGERAWESLDLSAWHFDQENSWIEWKFQETVYIGALKIAIKVHRHASKLSSNACSYSLDYSLPGEENLQEYKDLDGIREFSIGLDEEEVRVQLFDEPIYCTGLRLTTFNFDGSGCLRASICGYLEDDDSVLYGTGQPPEPSRHYRGDQKTARRFMRRNSSKATSALGEGC